MSASDSAARVVSADEGDVLDLGGFEIVYKVSSEDTGGAFAIVEHPMQPGTLAGPMHTHTHEDEISYVIEGEVGIRVGDREMVAGPGAYIVKPRGIPHTFWNAGNQPARLIEIIAPAGFEAYFRELAAIVNQPGEPDFGAIIALAGRYGLAMHMDSLGEIMQKHGVGFGSPA